MYPSGKQMQGTPPAMFESLRADHNGSERDTLIEELRAAEDEIHASLAMCTDAGEIQVLEGLLKAATLSIAEVSAIWKILHTVPLSTSHGKK